MADNVGFLRFRLLGWVEAEREGRPLVLGPGATSLLAALLSTPNEVRSTADLTEAIWGTRLPEHPHGALRNVVARLRKAAGAEVIVSVDGGYRITVGPDQLDLLEFDLLQAEADDAQRHGAFAAAVDILDDALALWHEPIFGNVNSESLHRDLVPQLSERHLRAHEERAELCLRLGRHRSLVAELDVLVARHPFRERLTGQLMLALYRSDRQADALRLYQSLRHTLAQELGVDPSESLRDLQLKILRADPDLRLGTDNISYQGTQSFPVDVPRQLPWDIADFTGRETEAALVIRSLTDAADGVVGPRLAILAGPGGIGKTTVAVHVAHLLSAGYPDGQLYVDLQGADSQPADSGEVLSWFLRSLGVPSDLVPEGLTARAGLYRSLLADRRVLVVLDNAADERQLRPLLPAGSEVGVIITARSRITGLPGGQPIQLDFLEDDNAIELLRKVIGPQRVEAERDQAQALVGLCGGLPLALRIVAARLAARPHHRLAAMVDRITDRRRRLSELSHADLDVRASLTLSYQGLSPHARTLLRRIGLLDRPDFAVWTAAALMDAPASLAQDVLDQLVDGQLVDVPEHGRYRCHDLVREFGGALSIELDPVAERDAALARAFGATLDLAERAHRAIYGGDYAILHGSFARWCAPDLDHDRLADPPLAWSDRERTAILSAIRHGAQLGWDELCWDLAATAVTLFEPRGYLDDWATAAEQALNLVRDTGNRRGEAALLCALGSREIGQQTCGRARARCERAERLFADIGDRHGHALALRYLARADSLAGRLDLALDRAEQARREAGNDRQLRDHVLCELIRVHLERGETVAVQGCVAELAQATGGPRHARVAAQNLFRLGDAYLMQNRLAEAEEAFQLALRTAAPGDLSREVYSKRGLAEVLLRRNEPTLAAKQLGEILRVAPLIPERIIRGRVLLTLGEAETARADHAAANRYLRESLSIFTDCEIPLWQARVLDALADLHLVSGAPTRAEHRRSQAQSLRRRIRS